MKKYQKILLIILSVTIVFGVTFFIIKKTKKKKESPDNKKEKISLPKEKPIIEQQKEKPKNITTNTQEIRYIVVKENENVSKNQTESGFSNTKSKNLKEDGNTILKSKKKTKFDFKDKKNLIKIGGIALIPILLLTIGFGIHNSRKSNDNNLLNEANIKKSIASIGTEQIAHMNYVSLDTNDVVLKIGDEEITYEKYQYYLETIKTSIDEKDESYWFEKNTTTIKDNNANVLSIVDTSISPLELEGKVIERLKEIVIINEYAKKYKIDITEEKVNANLQSIIDTVGEEEFYDVLKKNNISIELYKDILKNTMQEEELLKAIFKDEIIKNVSVDDIARIKHILITYNDEIVSSGDITEEMENIINENVQIGTTTTNTKVYEKEDVNSKTLTIFKENETFTIKEISEDGQWIVILYNSQNAYIENKDIIIEEKIISQDTNEENIINNENIVKQLSKQEAFDLSKEILNKLDNGADFDALMQQYTEDASMIGNDAGYYLQKTEDEEALIIEKVAFTLEENSYSKIIETNLGFHIIYRLPLEDSYLNEHLLDYTTDDIWEAYDALLEQETQKLKCEYKDNYVDAFTNTFVRSYENYLRIKSDNE